MSKNKLDRERQERLTALKKMCQRIRPAGIEGECYGTNNKAKSFLEGLGLARFLDPSTTLPSDGELAEMLAASLAERREPPAAESPAASVALVVSSRETEKPVPMVEYRPTMGESRDVEFRVVEEPAAPSPVQPPPPPTVEVNIVNVVERSSTAPEGGEPVDSSPHDERGAPAEPVVESENANRSSAEVLASDLNIDLDGLFESDDVAGAKVASEDSDGFRDDGDVAAGDSPPPRRRRSTHQRPKSGANPPWAIVTAAAAVGLLLLVGAILGRQQTIGRASLNDELARMKQQRDASRIAASTAAAEAEAAKELHRAAEAKLATAQAEKAAAIADHEAAKLLRQRRLSLKDLATERAQEVAQRHGIDLTQLESSTQRDLDLLAARLENERLEKEKRMLQNKLQQPGGSPPSAGSSTVAATVAPSAPPLKAEAGGDRTVNVGVALDFDGTASTGNIKEYRWRFGDGDEAAGKTASHTYVTISTFTVILTVTDDRGQTAQDSFIVTVK